MPTFLPVLQVVSQLLPMISGLVQSIEASFPSASGTGKLSVLQSTLESAFNDLGKVGVTFQQVWPTINGFVSAAVALYNASGLFTHASTAVNTVAGEISTAGSAATAVAQEVTTLIPAQTIVNTIGEQSVSSLVPTQAMSVPPTVQAVSAPGPFASVAAGLASNGSSV